MENSFFATKVTFCNMWYDIATACGVDYNELRECWLADPRINRNHTLVFPKDRGYGGKCLVPDTNIFTAIGEKEIKDVREGEKVITDDGSIEKVTEVFKRPYRGDLVRLKVQNLGHIDITPGHPVFAIKSGRKVYKVNGKNKLNSLLVIPTKQEWINVEDLSKGDFVALPILDRSQLMSSKICRLLGYYLANGCFDKKKHRFDISFDIKKLSYALDTVDIIKDVFNVNTHLCEDRKHNCVRVRGSSFSLCDIFHSKCGSYTHLKQLSSKEDISNIELFKGYFRGDGYFSSREFIVATVSKVLASQIKMFFMSQGITFSYREVPAKKDKNGTNHRRSYYIKVRKNSDLKTLKILIGDVSPTSEVKEKNATFNLNDRVFYPVKSISRYLYDGYVYNLEVANRHTYVTSCGIVHNCFPKDVKAIIQEAKNNKVNVDLLEAVDKVNEGYRDGEY
jgi:UDP-glucose 6-dehydrogenase